MPSCCVAGCKTRSGTDVARRDNVKFHRIPIARIKLWQRIINRKDWKASSTSRVCSRHFISGYPGWEVEDPDWIPTLFMKPSSTQVKAKRIRLSQSPNTSKILENKSVDPDIVPFYQEERPVISINEREERCKTREAKKLKRAKELKNKNFMADSLKASLNFHDYVVNSVSETVERKKKNSEIIYTSIGTQTITDPLLYENHCLKEKVQEYEEILRQKSWSVEKIQHDDNVTRFYTGMPTFPVFMWLFNFLKEKARKMTYYRASKVENNERKNVRFRKLSLINEFLAVLMRLKLGLLVQDIADRFDISISTFSEIFTTWICLLDRELCGLCPFPDKELVEDYMPKKFRKYPDTRIILDCTEVFIERSSDMLTQNVTFSSYKHHNTAKFLIGITPGGVISFISAAWGGRASDKVIVEKSGILDMLDAGDNVMADKGFLIEKMLEERGCKLNIPPIKKSNRDQFTEEEVLETRRIAELRIHVERSIGRIRNFHILDGVFPITQIKLISQIFSVCAYLTNINKPIIR